MIADLAIENYRGVSQCKISGLRQLSVLTGPNNSAKTTVLEAMSFFAALHSSSGPDHDLVGALVGHRALDGDPRPSLAMRPDLPAWIRSDDRAIVIHDKHGKLIVETHQGVNSHEITNGPRVRTAYRNPSNTVCFVAAPVLANPGGFEEAVSDAERRGYRRAVIAAAREVDPSISDLRLLLESGRANFYAESETDSDRLSLWPVAVGGTGFKRYLYLAATIAGAEGLVCVDDPDAFLHPGLYKHVAALLWKRIEAGAQVIVATHSPDLIEALAVDINGAPRSSQFGVYGLERSRSGQVSCTLRIKGADAQTARRRDDIRQLLGL